MAVFLSVIFQRLGAVQVEAFEAADSVSCLLLITPSAEAHENCYTISCRCLVLPEKPDFSTLLADRHHFQPSSRDSTDARSVAISEKLDFYGANGFAAMPIRQQRNRNPSPEMWRVNMLTNVAGSIAAGRRMMRLRC